VDLDRFVARHQPTWRRLESLARRDPSRLSADEIATLVADHHRTATHLSTARRTYGDPDLTAHLSALVATSGAVLYGTRARTWAALVRFAAETYPAALWHLRRHVAAAAALFLVVAVGLGAWAATQPAVLDALVPPALQDAYVEEDFVDYYSELPPAQFFAEVGVNNIQVGFLAFSTGIAAGLPTVYVLLTNGGLVGAVGGLFHARGVPGVFWSHILPHGLLELTAVFVAGGTGLALGWAWIDPGDRPRAAALREQASRAVTVVLGTIAVFVVAALIEGFVTGSGLPTWLRVGVGVVAEAAFLASAWVLGRRAAAQGLTGTIAQAERPTWDVAPAGPSAGARAALRP
jgi:uncharacterized membrane protein SpoIIM required for sporulation